MVENTAMRRLAKELGFAETASADREVVEVRLPLVQPS
jgi:hypothetical protein